MKKKGMKIIWAIIIIITLTNAFPLFAQSTEKIFLVFYQDNDHDLIKFPCVNISTCIDTLYNKGDTLSIRLIDDSCYRLDTLSSHRTLYYYGMFNEIKAKKITRQINIPVFEPKYNFVEMQIYDEIYFFKKEKKKTYVLENRQKLENKTLTEIKQKTRRMITYSCKPKRKYRHARNAVKLINEIDYVIRYHEIHCK